MTFPLFSLFIFLFITRLYSTFLSFFILWFSVHPLFLAYGYHSFTPLPIVFYSLPTFNLSSYFWSPTFLSPTVSYIVVIFAPLSNFFSNISLLPISLPSFPLPPSVYPHSLENRSHSCSLCILFLFCPYIQFLFLLFLFPLPFTHTFSKIVISPFYLFSIFSYSFPTCSSHW